MSNAAHDKLPSILAHWLTPAELTGLEVEEVAGGLSGAKLWKISTAQESFCLRRWPFGFWPSIDHLKSVHGLIEHVWTAGLQRVPLPRRALSDVTFVEAQGHIWELTTWLPGEVVDAPSEQQSTAAVTTLAHFHLKALTYGDQWVAVAPGLQKRGAVLEDLQRGGLADLEMSVRCSPPSTEREVALTVLDDLAAVLPFSAKYVYDRSAVALPLQWCLRDVHIGNFLFSGDALAGIVDFGATAVDSVVGDLVRLIASFAGEDRDKWHSAVDRYEQRRLLNTAERQAIGAYAMGGWIGGAANWLRWRFIENRTFANAEITQTRLSELAARIKALRTGDGVFSEKLLGK